MALAGLT